MKLAKFYMFWIIWTVFGSVLIYGVSSSEGDLATSTIIVSIISLAPLLGIMLTMGVAQAANQFNDWVEKDKYSMYILAGGITLFFTAPGVITGVFNPYATIIFGFTAIAVWGSLAKNRGSEFIINWTDLALWMLLWIPFDLRWSSDLLPALDFISYTWWSVAVSVIAIIGWQGFRGVNIGFNLKPIIKDIYLPIVGVLLIMLLVVPLGLLTGFLTFAMPETYDMPKLALHFIGLFLTVALPEELFFRGILLNGLEGRFSKKWIPMAISSVAFGLMHWNNVSVLSDQIIYVFLATVAGVGYGWVYRKGGNSLLAAILTHTLIDWIWKLFLTG